MSGPPEIALFIGHLHPLLVHLPIGLIVLLAILEACARIPRFKSINSNTGFILALTVPLIVATAVCGWLLSLAGGYQEKLLQLHKWTGIGTAAACLVAGLLYWSGRRTSYRVCLFSTVAALTVASHFGGSLTHGSDYLVRYAPAPVRRWLGAPPPAQPGNAQAAKALDVATLQVFPQVVQPILQKDCIACHGAEKSKGKLRLDSLAATLQGGDSGPDVIPGKGAESPLIKRLRLPLAEEDHMPPEGKPQPEPDDIALLQWWIDAGAPDKKTVGELKPPLHIAQILENRFGAPAPLANVLPAKPLAEVLPLAEKAGADLNVVINPLSPKEPWLECTASVLGTNFGDEQLRRLSVLAPNLRWLDLAGTAVSDAGLAPLAGMQNLTRLHLERTTITDAGLAHLATLRHLEYLDLYGTGVTDAGLQTLEKLPQLKQLYLWETHVTPAAAKAFAEARMDREQLQRWESQIAELQAKIRDANVSVELGTTTAAADSPKSAAVNTVCPVSGKPVDVAKTVDYEGHTIAFCCDDCKAKFQKEPAAFLAKLGKLMPKDSATPSK